MNETINIYGNIPTIAESETNIKKINSYSIRRTLVFVAFFDLIFEIINGFYYALNNNEKTLPLSYTHFICAAFILAGIYGINRYNSCSSRLYGIYIVLRIVSYIAILFSYNLSLFALVFISLIIILNIWIIRLLTIFTSNLQSLSRDDIDSLKSGWKPNIHTVILI